MGFSRYSIEKKQVSTDRGVTWSDCTPSETQRGNLIGTYRTLLECEDAACELEEYRYSVIEGALPSEFCGNMISVLPSGIAKTIQFTAGALCCSEWQTASPYAYDYQRNENVSLALGKINCYHDFNTTYCPSFTYSANTVVGMEVHNHCFDVRQHKDWICPETLCSCFQITEFMPWCENKTSWKLIKKQRYYREHCSDEWIEDGEPVVIGIAERWRFISDDYNQTVWRHEVGSTFDENGGVAEWTKDGDDLIFYNENELDSELTLSGGTRSIGDFNENYPYLLHNPKYNAYKEYGWANDYKQYGVVTKDGNDFTPDNEIYAYVVYDDDTDEVITEPTDFSYLTLNLNHIKKAVYGGKTTRAESNLEGNNVTQELVFKGVPKIGKASSYNYSYFSSLRALTKVTIENGTNYIGVGCFCGNPLLTTIDIPSSVELIQYRAFMDNTNLEKIIFRGVTPPSVYSESGTEPFRNSNECPVYVPDESLTRYISALYMIDSNRIKPLSQMPL